jgi:hypothetical protein
MATRSPEGNPYNIDPKTVRVAPEQSRVGSGFKKPEAPKQQPSNPSHELTEYYKREQERHSGVLENPIRVQRPLPQKPGEERGEAAPFQHNPAEQHARERLSKPPPEADEQNEAEENEFPLRVFPSATYVNPLKIDRGNKSTDPRNPSEQRGGAEPFQPNPAEQQTPQRRRTQRERAKLAQDPELRSLADELWEKVLTKGRLTEVISESLSRYPGLTPDEALKEYRNDFQGFSFA